MDAIKVLMLSWEYPPHSVGGLARHVEELAEALAAQGVEIHVLSIGKPENPKLEERNGVIVHRVEPYSISAPNFLLWVQQLNLRFVEEAVKIFNAAGPFDLLHAHDWLVAFAGRALKHGYTVPLLATIHATEAGRNQGIHTEDQHFIHSIEWWLTYEAWKVIVCSEHMQEEVKGLFGLPGDKIMIIPNGVNPQKFQAARQNVSFGSEKIIFFVGRLVREKGVHVLLEAAPQVLAGEGNVKFVIAGTGPMEAQLKHQAHILGLGNKVEFWGYIDDDTRNSLYQQAYLAVFPSLYEPFGIVALEAMAAGVPVVVSDTGGMGQIISHGVNGLKAYPGDSRSLATNILQALKNEVLRQELKNNGKRSIEDLYSWARIAANTAKVYQLVLAEHARSPWGQDHVEKKEHPLRNHLVEQRLRNFAKPEGRKWL